MKVMKKGGKNISVFDYKDYRKFLNDWYVNRKQKNKAFSYRSFAKKAGFKTSNFLMLVIQAKRNLTQNSLTKMIKGLDLNKQEQEFFSNLVFYNQAKTNDDKNRYYQNLIQSRKFNELKPIEKQSYEYYSKWYHPVIRELVCSQEFDGTMEWISSRLYPKVTPTQCTKSIELLETLGFVIRTNEGRYKQASSIISTGANLTSVVVHNYHKTLLELSREMMDRLTIHEKDVSALTLGVKRERLKEIADKIRNFRKEILSLVSDDTEPEEVVQLQIQFFPVTKLNSKP